MEQELDSSAQDTKRMINTVIVVTLYVGYYFVSKPFLRKLSSSAARSSLPILTSATIAERQATFQMSLVVAAHLIMVCILSFLVLPPQWWLHQTSHLGFQSVAVLLAILLGIGESVASGVLAEMLYGLLGWIDRRREQLVRPSRLAADMVEASAGGWMKTIRGAVEANLIMGGPR
ncbi:hypothetical protein V7F85_03775 [Cutibacterium avidum]|uniref:hypothetical protein n=1 Tax=Cutibacterium avidum TaxID=33010 RepID=UPI002FF0BAE0